MNETPFVEKMSETESPATLSQIAPPLGGGVAVSANSRLLLFVLAGLIVLLVAAFYLLVPGFYEQETDDAYVEAHVVSVISKLPAYAQALYVDDNHKVTQGQLLVQLDPRDYMVQVSLAQANLASADGKLQDARNQIPIADADTARQRAELNVVQANAKLAEVNLGRLQSVSDVRAVSSERVDEARTAVVSTRAGVVAAQVRIRAAQAQATLAYSQARTAEAAVAQARAALAQATLNLSYTKIYATGSGTVTNKSVEPGNYVQPGQLLLSVVPETLFVIANYKETQLKHVKVGQPVMIRIDAFPDLLLRGHVESIQHGTGSRFALLPPENATGNFVKVVQRIPVKILFDDQGEVLRRIAPGMSVETRISTRERPAWLGILN